MSSSIPSGEELSAPKEEEELSSELEEEPHQEAYGSMVQSWVARAGVIAPARTTELPKAINNFLGIFM